MKPGDLRAGPRPPSFAPGGLRDGDRVHRFVHPLGANGPAEPRVGTADGVGPLRFRVRWDDGAVRTYGRADLGAYVRRGEA